jgi:hypothetical protein
MGRTNALFYGKLILFKWNLKDERLVEWCGLGEEGAYSGQTAIAAKLKAEKQWITSAKITWLDGFRHLRMLMMRQCQA